MTSPAATGRSGRAGVVVALSVAMLQVACSTTYQPRHSGRVGVVIHHGAAAYVKDGRELPVGPFGGNLEGLVSDVPAAAAGWVVIGVGARRPARVWASWVRGSRTQWTR